MSEKEVVNRQRIRVLRGRILRTLRHFYSRKPNSLGFESIRHAVDRAAFSPSEIREQIQWAMDSGYVVSPDNKRDALDIESVPLFALTAKGLSLLNAEISDPGVEIELAEPA